MPGGRGPRLPAGRFGRILFVIVVAGFAVRVAYVVGAKLDEAPAVGDQLFYNAAANRLAAGDGFVEPFDPDGTGRPGTGPAADHPPLTVILLAPVSLVTGDSPGAHRLLMVALGTVTVLLIGLLGRAVAGPGAGLIAAAIAALYPNLWVNDGLIMSESVSALLVTVALLLAYRLLRSPDRWVAVALGAVCGLASLARAELVLLVPLLLIPACLLAPSAARAARLRLAVVGALVAGFVIAPWVGYNLVRFEEPVFISTNDGIALLGSNCDSVYSSAGTGLTDLSCLGGNPPGDQSVDSQIYRDRAIDYVAAHPGRAVVVALARMGRTWSVFRPADMLEYNEGEARERWVTALGLVAFYPLFALAACGCVILRRRCLALWPLLVPAGIVTVASAVTYGQTRFRVPAEPGLVVLAAAAIEALARRWLLASRRRSRV